MEQVQNLLGVFPQQVVSQWRPLWTFLAHLNRSQGASSSSIMELAALASILAYENEARIKDTVDNKWQMSFVEFFECWNMNINAYETEAFICCDKQEDPNLIIVAFRGTTDLNDWKCDFNMSLIKMSDMGMVHLGFMTSLGLDAKKACSGNNWNINKGFPKDYTGNKPLAYYSIRKVVKNLVGKHKNAKILLTGHSLGGALAILYTSLLVMHEENDLLKKISCVITFGQPRVGDSIFGDTMLKIIGKKYIRLVYRYDIVPRIPFELPIILKFDHFGACINYHGWYFGKMVKRLPNMNYFNVFYGQAMFWDAVVDLLRAIWGIKDGEWEGVMAIFYRGFWMIFPGVAFHNTRDYLNSVRMAKIAQ
ncbi:Triacylglycerol lipase protein [Dioscorea alata]|uniref:Triacylglycerol lipase protein n=1 Tax=Dioscorea alata TaxID=55571 RepID=A0ACB7VRC0_DIOAL|nr:Triacylglycerol lipase protein [Dioscorea alata]